jgi:hypothetical protein
MRKIWAISLAVLPLLLLSCVNGGVTTRAPGPNEENVWTIRCAAISGPERYRRAKAQADALRQVSGLKPNLVQVINADDESIIYYGFYRRDYNREKDITRFHPDPLPDLELIRSLSLVAEGRNVWPFIYATMEEYSLRVERHPEWNLENANGYWSLHIAVFFNEGVITNRRYLAEEYCRELREDQQVEAYYHHGPVRSSVYVGLFSEQAVRTVQRTHPLTGEVTAVNQIVDERLLELQHRFPRSLQNARVMNEIIRDPQTGQIKQRLPFKSFLVKIPRAEQATIKLPGGG